MKSKLFIALILISGVSTIAATNMIIKLNNGEKVCFKVEEVKEIVFEDTISGNEENIIDQSETPLIFKITSNSAAELAAELKNGCIGDSSVIIPSKIKIEGTIYDVIGIGSNAFSGCDYLTHVVIPHGVVYIADNAFENCYNLTNINIPESVTTIEDRAFYFCSKLKNIVIPEEVTKIGYDLFYNCKELCVW